MTKNTAILICDSLPQNVIDGIQGIPGVKADVDTGLSPKDLKSKLDAYEIVVVRSATKITEEVLEDNRSVKVIARAGMGIDNIDVEAATRKGIIVMNTPARNSIAAGEMAIGMMFALFRNISAAHAALKQGEWKRKQYMGREVAGKTLGLLGFGNVGREVAKRGVGLGMDVRVYDPFVQSDEIERLGYEASTLEKVISSVDVLSVHVSLNEQTENLLNEKKLRSMKEGSYLVNCARGGIVNEEDLLSVLNDGHLAGAGVDVFAEEPPPSDHPLLAHPKVVCTPHLGASTFEAQEQVGLALINQIRLYKENELVVDGVNVPSVGTDTLLRLGKFLDLGERLGSFLGQTFDAAVNEIDVQVQGELDDTEISALSSSVLVGFLKSFCSAGLNFVNAPLEAKQRGIRMVTSKASGDSGYNNLITVTAKQDQREASVAGTLIGRKNPKIIRWNEYDVEIDPYGHILVVENEDKPGMLGGWSSLIGQEGINIRYLHLSSNRIGQDKALSVTNTDKALSEKTIQKLKDLGGIYSIRQVNLA